MGAYSVNIIGLSNNVHHFEYEIGDAFFREYGTDFLSKGVFHADVALNKHETFIEAEFQIKGNASLICDRSLEPFDFPIKSRQRLMFKFGDTDQEMSDEIVMIHRDTATLELGQYIYEYIALEVPIKKLHPKFRDEADEDDGSEGKIVYTSGDTNKEQDDQEIDPRWNELKKLK